MVLSKPVSVSAPKKTTVAFLVCFTLSLFVVGYLVLTESCTYTSPEFQKGCDENYVQVGQSIAIQLANGQVTTTKFKSNAFTQYHGFNLTNCNAVFEQLKTLRVTSYLTWSDSLNSIKCDGDIDISLDSLGTQGADDFFGLWKQLIDKVLSDVPALAGPKLYFLNLYPENYIMGTADGQVGDRTTGYDPNTLTLFGKQVAKALEGSKILMGYSCHNCIVNKGPFNWSFTMKAATSMFSLAGAVFGFLAFIFTRNQEADYRKLEEKSHAEKTIEAVV